MHLCMYTVCVLDDRCTVCESTYVCACVLCAVCVCTCVCMSVFCNCTCVSHVYAVHWRFPMFLIVGVLLFLTASRLCRYAHQSPSQLAIGGTSGY